MRQRVKINLKGLPKFRFGRISVLTLGGFLILVLGAFYLLVVNISATKGFSLKVLEREKAALQGENERLAVEAARLKSLAVIDQNASGDVEIVAPATGEQPLTTQGQTQATGGEQSRTISLGPKMVPVESIRYLLVPGPLASRE